MLDQINAQAEAEEQAIAIARRFRKDPLGFVQWAFTWGRAGTPLAHHEGPEPWQTELLAGLRDDLVAGRSPLRVAVASGHGVGKSALVAWLVLWALATQPGCAPALRKSLWRRPTRHRSSAIPRSAGRWDRERRPES